MARVAPIAPAPHGPLAALQFGRAGEPAPPVLLLHGQPGQASVWRQVGDQLHAHGVYALAVDRPGYGRSHRPAVGFAGNADAIVEFLDHHGIDQVTVVAHSWASGAAIALAVGFPERVASMVLLAPVGAASSVDRLDRLLAVPVVGWGVLRGGLRLGAWLLDRDGTRRLLPAGFGDLDPIAAKRMAGSARSSAARRSAAVEQRALVVELPQLRGALRRLDVPTLVLAGSHDLIVSTSSSRDLAGEIPGAEFEVVDAGHLLPTEVPERVADVIMSMAVSPA
jgi:pimeloyl-ACP methyl ester carboxylesterase